MLTALSDRAFPAAVISSSDPRAASAARAVPKNAKVIRLGDCVVGYRCRPERFKRFRLADMRFAELDRLACLRFQDAPPDEDNALLFARVIANHAPRDKAARWVERWCGLADWNDVEDVLDEASHHPETWRADSLARILKVTKAERDALGLRTIGAVDFTKRDRTIARKAAAAERMREVRARQRAARNVTNRCVRSNNINQLRTRKSKTVTSVLAAIGDGRETVGSIVARTGLSNQVVRTTLTRLVASGRIARVARGTYRIAAEKRAPVRPALKRSKSVSGPGSLRRLSKSILDIARPIQIALRGRGRWLVANASPPTLATLH